MMTRALTALPVYNEVAHVSPVLDEVLRYCREVLVVDDGSRDGTAEVLIGRGDVHVVTHAQNRGYGRRCSRPSISPCATVTTCW